jgi:predicted enzyme related to lactoylglutathione lyase
LIDASGVDFFAVPVSDLARADRFYGETLGLARNPHASGERWVEYETGNLTLALSTFGGVIALGVPDVEEARAKLEGEGVAFGHDTFDSGVCHGAGFADPDGNRLQLHKRYAPLEPWQKPETEVERTDFVGISIADMPAAKAFYADTLGIRSPNLDDAWPELEAGNVSLYLIDPTRIGREFAPNTWQVALRVPDVEESRRRLEAEGVEFQGETLDTGVCHMAFFSDPDGNALMLHRRYAPPTGTPAAD